VTQTNAVLDPNLPIPCSICSDFLAVRIASICSRCSSGEDSFYTPINNRCSAPGMCTWEKGEVNISCRHKCSSLVQQVFATTYQFTSIKPAEISKGSCDFDAIKFKAWNLWRTQFQDMFIQKPNSSKYLSSVIAKVVPRRLHLRNEIRFSSQALSLRHPKCGSLANCRQPESRKQPTWHISKKILYESD
jgi:hypothetical protein